MCHLCQTKPVYEFTNKRKVCSRCFINWFEKKFLYTIRKFQMIKHNNTIAYENKNDFKGVVLENLLKMFAEKSNIELIRFPTKKKSNKVAVPGTTDSEANKIIHAIIKNKTTKLNEFLPVFKKTIKLLYLFLDKEILLYAKLKKLKFKTKKQKHDKISKFLDNSEKKHPEIKRAIVSSILRLN